MTDTETTTGTTISRLMAENAALKRTQARVVSNVMEYEGCREGKLEFLETCGISIPSHTVKMTVLMNVEPGTDYADLVDSVQSALDSYCDENQGGSAYVVGRTEILSKRASDATSDYPGGSEEPTGWVGGA